jgi:Domain of unknown function (DUF1949)
VQALLKMDIPCELMGPAFNLLDKAGADRRHERYQSDGSLSLQVAVPEQEAGRLARQLEDTTAGRVVASVA